MSAFCLLMTLGPNAYDKLGYLVFLPLSMLAVSHWLTWTTTTKGAHRAVVALTVAYAAGQRDCLRIASPLPTNRR